MNWHQLSRNKLLLTLNTRSEGLRQEEAEERLQKYGPNELQSVKRQSPIIKFLNQFKGFMTIILIGAAILASVMGDFADATMILIIVIINAVFGFVQEYRAEKAVEALKSLSAPKVSVIRDGDQQLIPASELVPGDKILLEAGQVVPADVRILEAYALKTQEAALTGESDDVEKHNRPLKDRHLSPGDQKNMAFKGTAIASGRGTGIVVETGMNTEMGKIALMLGSEEAFTPLQIRMSDFGRKLSMIVAGVCVVLFVVGYLRGEELLSLFLTSISLAVAAIPESLPAVITISLALGARRMVKRLALIRKLPAVETLGSVTYICTDKTGTLTQNKMRVEKVALNDDSQKELFFLNLALSNDVVMNEKGKITGDTTEIALYDYAGDHQYEKFTLLTNYPRVAEIPFDPFRKRMSTLHRYEKGYLLLVKGAFEALIDYAENQAIEKKKLRDKAKEMAGGGYRVIAHGYRYIDTLTDNIEKLENNITLLGLSGIIDPLRPEVKKAVESCYLAGIQPVMITGDHPETARHIAVRIGILKENEAHKKETIITGKGLSKLSEEAFLNQVKKIKVYARVSPEQKLYIVKALQNKGQFVAMTGDGVNDAPALKNADIGIAMGITGTDVSKEAAHMILMDDNFSTIIHAIHEGRRIFDNIRKFIKYTLTSNAGEIWAIFLAPLVGLPIPLLPVHILWINLVTDGLPGLALSVEKAEPNIMRHPPRDPRESIFAKGLGIHVLWVGLLMGSIVLATQSWAMNQNIHWRTMVFNVLCLSQMGHVLAIRSEERPLFSMSVFSNKPLLGAVLLTFVLQVAITYLPFLQEIFKTQALTVSEFIMVIFVSSITFFVVEIEKLVIRKNHR